ncbi:ATP-grasp domain-containing protein [Membranihabitans marinus]|uniref:hypothetical protein n=1 Tax=Membranihabitans marinus TaxID=1227546 RepID=UPI001F429324|nr:hypothetical protein [Membranihabitans marinus]
MNTNIEWISPGSFSSENHWYPKALNATIHPMVSFFFSLDKTRIITRYCHLHPRVDKVKLYELLTYQCKYFQWCGADLINATSENGNREMVVIENNSSPSGQKSMPLLDENNEAGSYKLFIERTFKPLIKKKKINGASIEGRIAVFYDKNYTETSGYAATIADVMKEDVLLIPYYNEEDSSLVKVEDEIIMVYHQEEWIPLRAIFRYLTQKPWNRLPIKSKTKILNPIVACLAGGRNKMIAAKAYEMFNESHSANGLKINIPDTIYDVKKEEIPAHIAQMGGHGVIKIPYSNAGQGVFTIINQKELDSFMAQEFRYEQFIVQSLIGNYNWSSISKKGKFYQVGTIPNHKGETFVTDLRMMASTTKEGIKPLCIYARRTASPLTDELDSGSDSWKMLGTNLSIKLGENQWASDSNRLMLMDRRDFNKLGIGLDDLIEAYIQTVLSMIAIDKMCKKLISTKGDFKWDYFRSINDDETLINEIMH